MTGTNSNIQVSMKRSGCYAAAGWLAVGIILALSSVCAAAIQNPSFETYYLGMPWPRQLPQSWAHSDHASFNSYCTNLWATDGTLSTGLFSRINKTFLPGNYQSFHQFVDLTGIGSIVFDVRLAACPSGTFEHFEAVFLVDGAPLWTKREGGVHLNQQVNVPNMAGWHRIEIRLTALDNGPFTLAYWTQWDNLRLVEGQVAIKATIALDPNTLNLASNGNWITGYIELEPGYDAVTIDGASVELADVSACTDGQGWATRESNAENTADYDGDGIVERMVKFDRSAIQGFIQGLVEVPPEVTLKVTGQLTEDGTPFEGTGVIRVIDKGPKGK